MLSSPSWSTTTSTSSQVEIRHRPVSWRFNRSEFGETLEFYDDFHEEIVLINSEFIYKSHKQSSKLNKFNIKIPNHTSILNAKFSPQNKYIGLQINRHELVCDYFVLYLIANTRYNHIHFIFSKSKLFEVKLLQFNNVEI